MTSFSPAFFFRFFFFNDTATTEIYTLSLHDALPIFQTLGSLLPASAFRVPGVQLFAGVNGQPREFSNTDRSEEHTSELQSQSNLVCRLLLEKKKSNTITSAAATSNSTTLTSRT